MTDPESRDIKTSTTPEGDNPGYVYQIEYPIGTIFCITGFSMIDALEKLQASGIEPFMIRRAGILMPMEG